MTAPPPNGDASGRRRHLQEGEVGLAVKVRDLQVAVDDLAAGVEQPQGLVVVLQAGGQGQLHVGAQANCKADASSQHRVRKHTEGSRKSGAALEHNW